MPPGPQPATCRRSGWGLAERWERDPNIVVIVADDMRWDAMSCAGQAVARTPHLDRLAARGTRFTEAFVTTSICCVSRASILTGQHARRHGVGDFQTPVRDLAALYPMILRRAGYETGFIGKWGIAQSKRPFFQECALAFDFWAGEMGQSSYWHDRSCGYLRNTGRADRADFFCTCPAEARRAEGCGPGGPHPALADPVHAETRFIPDKVRAFLDTRAADKPFCISVSLKAPHGPWRGYAPGYAEQFAGVGFPVRANVSPEEARRQPDFLRRSLEGGRGLRIAGDAVERDELTRQYFRLVLGVDACVGEIVGELERRGLAERTVVVFTSDNGHFLGEHGFFGKWLPHEESIRVPMVVADPRVARPVGVSDAMVLNIDIAPTLLDLAGLPAPDSMQGASLRPFLGDPEARGREAFFYEHAYEHAPQPPMHIEPSEAVRTRDAKLILWPRRDGPEREQFFDLRADPLETTDLARDPAAADRVGKLRDLLAELRDRAR
jgi:arylsulfatase A-like enzyme